MSEYPKTLAAIGSVILGTAIVLIQSVAAAKTPVEVNKTAQAMTVMIVGENQGSGVILQQQGNVYTVLTAAHVVKSEQYRIVAPDHRQYQIVAGSIRKAGGDIDLAVFKFQAAAIYPTAKLGSSGILTGGSDIYVAGFPGVTHTITTSVFVFRKGEVSANSNQTFEGGYSLIYSNDTLPGMSGGPVLNSEGELVAIHGRGDREQSSSGEPGAKTGFNLGIPIDRFLSIASTLGVKLARPIVNVTAPKTSPAADALAAGLQKERKDDYQGALKEYDRAISIDPRYADAYIGRGFIRYKLGERSNAAIDFSTAITLNPKSARGYNNRGNLYLEFKDWEYAIADFDRAIEIDANYADAYIGRGVAKESWPGDKTQGMVDLNMAIIIDPKSVRAYRSRANARLNIDDSRGAIEDYTKAMNLSPKLAADYQGRGVAKSKLKDYPAAISDYNLAIKIDPNYALAYYHRGLSKYENSDQSGAISDLQQAQKILIKQGEGKTFKNDLIIRTLKKWQTRLSS
jgi:tetratricopeptide (TPR) repeat protein